MKHFDYYNYSNACPLATDIENLVNDCGTPKSHLEKITLYYREHALTPRDMFEFFVSCLGYWSETEYFDDRNKYAVFGSRVIVEKFPFVKTHCKKDDILLNAFGFTLSAHRYLQNELFKTILYYFEEKEDSLWLWWNESEFVYNDDLTALVPYKK